uniref:RNA-directed RNA polymerase n=1 Tax=Bolahun virus variant 1 TaxID=1903426 RepID=A0A1C9U5D4_9VIRU|nr:RdRp [Bolahun virus variant 1]
MEEHDFDSLGQFAYESLAMFADIGVQEKKKRRVFSCIPGHLSQPIYGMEVDMMLGGMDKWHCARHRRIYKKVKHCSSFRNESDPYGFLQDWIESDTIDFSRLRSRLSILRESCNNFEYQKLAHCYPLRRVVRAEVTQEHCRDYIKGAKKIINDLENDLRKMMKVEKLKDNICFRDIQMGDFMDYRGCHFERDLSIINFRGKSVLFPTSLVLCVADKCQSLFGLKLYWKLTDLLNRYPRQSIYETGMRLYKDFRKLRSRKMEGFYGFCASFEPLIVGHTIARPDDQGYKDLLEHQSQEMQSYLDSTGLGISLSRFLPPDDASEVEIRMWLELTGMVKIMGYPILKEEMLLDQQREYGVYAHQDFNDETMQDIHGVMVRDFCIQYRDKRGRYPNFSYCPEEIYKYVSKDKLIPPQVMRDYRTWSQVRFDRTLEFDYSPDLSDVTKDSAAALKKSQWPNLFDECAFRYHYGKPSPYRPDPGESITRVIDAFLKAEQDLVRKIIRKRENNEYDEEDHIAVQCGKEMEHKEDTGRAFTKQTPNQRFFQVTLELNTAEQIFKFVPEQSMTDGEVALANRQMNQYKSLGGDTDFFNCDLKKWCLNFRWECVWRAGRMYDELFGLNGIYEQSHNFFLHCYTFCNSRLCPPDYDSGGTPLNGTFFMDNFSGGYEGMHQKKWTHIAVATIKLALERSGCKGTMMGQGDNQIVIIHYTREQLPRREEVRARFMQQCELLFRDTGHTLKRRETWYSSKLHEYGKVRTYKGATISQGTKKATKLVADVNDGLFAHDSGLSTTNTQTEAIAKGTQNPDVAFMINQILISNFLDRKDLIWGSGRSRAYNCRLLLNFPTDFGGIPLSTYHSHAVRGHDDPVTLWVSIYKVYESYNRDLYRDVMRIIKLTPSGGLECNDWTRLIEDPRALRIRTLPTANREISEISLRYLKSDEVTNPAIRRLYESNQSTEYSILVSHLAKMTPLYASLANVILKDSNAGIGKSLQSKFTNIKTIEKSAQKFSEVSLTKLVAECNLLYSKELKARCMKNKERENIKVMSFSHCPTAVAEQMRITHWSKELVGSTKPCHISQVVLKSMDDCTDEELGKSILIKLSRDIREGDCNKGLCSFGPYKGYVGSKTQVKTKHASINISNNNSYTKGLKSLGRTKTWMELLGNTNLAKLCNDLMEEKMIDLSEIVTQEQLKDVHDTVISGNPFHRLVSQVESTSSSINGMITLTSHFHQTSNLMQGMTSEGEDHRIFFQYIYSADMACILSIAGEQELPPMICAIFECEECTIVLPDPKFDFPEVTLPSVPSNYIGTPCAGEEFSTYDFDDAYSKCLGIEIALNVDENFKVNHGNRNYSSEDIHIVKTKISINDFKRCSLFVIIGAIVTNSDHCRNLIVENRSDLTDIGNDLSFSGFADLILESGKRTELFSILGRDVSEHTMVTRAERLSAYISRNLNLFFLNHHNNIRQIVLPIEFRGQRHELPWNIKEFRRFTSMMTALGIPYNRRLYISAVRKGNIAAILSALEIEAVRVPVFRYEVVKHWRRQQVHGSTVVVSVERNIDVDSLRFPLSEICSHYNIALEYKLSATINREELSFLCRPILSLSSAASKYWECMSAMASVLSIKTDPSVDQSYFCCLAEGSAGLLASLLDGFPHHLGMYNSKMDPDIDNRDIANDTDPPAVVASNNMHRIVHRELSRGETDITQPRFLEKLRLALRGKRISLLTMDAESMDRNDNDIHVENLMPIVYESDVERAIFKLFLSSGLRDRIREIMDDYADKYQWCLYKPISSNPCGHEIFLLVDKHGTTPNIRLIDEIYPTIEGYMLPNPRLSEESFGSYVHASRIIYHLLNSTFRNSSPTHGDRPIDQYSCGLICIHNLYNTCNKIQTCEAEVLLTSSRILMRGGGKVNQIFRMLHDLLFLLIHFSGRRYGLYGSIRVLEHLTVDKERVAQLVSGGAVSSVLLVSLEEGLFFKSWSDAKFFLRHYHRGSCLCSRTNNKPIPRTPGVVSRLLDDLKLLNYLDRSEYGDVFRT